MTKTLVVCVSLSTVICLRSIVKIEPVAAPLVETTATFAPCNCDKTVEMPPPFDDTASTENGISDIRDDIGADEL